MRRLSMIVIAVGLLLTACSPSQSDEPAASTPSTTTTAPGTPATTATTTTTTTPLSPLAGRTTPLGSALYDPQEHAAGGPIPTSVSVERIGVSGATIVEVGVADNGDMEIPGADAVGWYRFNPIPGEQGSSVLAAHISFNGRPGVFRYLAGSEIGDVVTVGFDDGTESRFEIVEVSQYNKGDLPKDRVFAKTGEPVLTLITCGGDFNRSIRSYEDNIVAYAIPIGS